MIEHIKEPTKDQKVGDAPVGLDRLNLIRFRRKANAANLADWTLLEEKQDLIRRYFNKEINIRFKMRRTLDIAIYGPIILLLYLGVALAVAIYPPINLGLSEFLGQMGGPHTTPQWVFFGYLLWTSGMSAMGALGFMAVNHLSIQKDATFDISDTQLVMLRVLLGTLFGCVISLPFCFSYFNAFTQWIASSNLARLTANPPAQVQGGGGLFLILPFLLGFSTSVVMALLNRMIKGIATLV